MLHQTVFRRNGDMPAFSIVSMPKDQPISGLFHLGAHVSSSLFHSNLRRLSVAQALPNPRVRAFVQSWDNICPTNSLSRRIAYLDVRRVYGAGRNTIFALRFPSFSTMGLLT